MVGREVVPQPKEWVGALTTHYLPRVTLTAACFLLQVPQPKEWVGMLARVNPDGLPGVRFIR